MASSSKSGLETTPSRSEKSPESFESLRRRNAALEILESYEKLSWMAFRRGESMAQTRIHFGNIVAGLHPDDETANPATWKEDLTPHPPKPGEEPRLGRKGKERVSSGAVSSPRAAGDCSSTKRGNEAK